MAFLAQLISAVPRGRTPRTGTQVGPDDIVEHDVCDVASDKKTDNMNVGVGDAGEPAPGYISSFASSMWRGTSTVLGAGVSSVKWVAGKGASATSSVASHVPVVNRYVAKPEAKNKSD